MSNLRRKVNINDNGVEIFTDATPGVVELGNNLLTKNNLGMVAIGDGSNPNLDAFGRLRISQPVSLFESILQFNKQSFIWDESISGGGSSTHLPHESSVRLRCGTASGDEVIRQTFQYFRYQAGKSQLIEMTGVMGEKKTNVRKRLGYFDADNGLFFEQDENNLKVVRRTKVTGTAVDNATNQTDWNIDKLDGTGDSGYNLDMTKTHIFVVDLQWLGVGRVRFGFVIDGNLVYCHEILNANILEEVYMTTANLPLRYEIKNTGAAASNTDLKQICCAVLSEGGFEDNLGYFFGDGNGATTISTTTRRPIFSIRPKTTFNSITNRGSVIPIEKTLFTDGQTIYYEVILNGTLTGASFSSVNTESLVESDVSATAITGGYVLEQGYLSSSRSQVSNLATSLKTKKVLSNNIAGTTTDIITIVATSFAGATAVSAGFNWKELY